MDYLLNLLVACERVGEDQGNRTCGWRWEWNGRIRERHGFFFFFLRVKGRVRKEINQLLNLG